MRLMQLLAVTVTGLVLASCANVPRQGYEGPPLPDTETALVQTRAQQGRAQITIAAVDDQDYDAFRVRVLPGDRCVTIQVSQYQAPDSDGVSRLSERTDAILCFEAIAGRTYEAGVSDSAEHLRRSWLVDLETGETVAEDDPRGS